MPGGCHVIVSMASLAFAFFVSKFQQSFYKRYIRDFMRYKDVIQCAGAALVAAVRQDALREDPHGQGVYYALHIRRGDFQFKVTCVCLQWHSAVQSTDSRIGCEVVCSGHCEEPALSEQWQLNHSTRRVGVHLHRRSRWSLSRLPSSKKALH